MDKNNNKSESMNGNMLHIRSYCTVTDVGRKWPSFVVVRFVHLHLYV